MSRYTIEIGIEKTPYLAEATRGGFTVDMEWHEDILDKADISGRAGTKSA